MAKLMFPYKISITYSAVMLALFMLLMILQDHLSYGKPYDKWSDTRPTTECDLGGEIEILCQKCAKQTKSNLVYPMCCGNQEEAREWCHRYINFGLQ